MVFSYRRHVIWLYTNIKLLCADNFFFKNVIIIFCILERNGIFLIQTQKRE